MIGQTLGHYRIESQLGAGGMGVVYRARDSRLGRTVAVKVLGEQLLSDPTARERFLREARTASALNHPHICTVHEVGEADGQVFIVMEHVEGKPLRELVPVGGFPVETAIRYGIQIADALAHAHEHNIVHRDLKTANVVVTPEGRAKVLDFGLARRVPRTVTEEEATGSVDSLTEAGVIVGTVHYMAPETLQAGPADARTDLWALGVILYEMVSGKLPFEGRTLFEVTAKILQESPPPLPPRVPAGLAAIIQRCLAKEPGQRYQRASEVRAALETAQSVSTPLAVSQPGIVSRRTFLWGTGAVTGAVLLSMVGLEYFGGHGRVIDSIAILPLANAGGDPETEYLSDGITENVIGRLSQLPKLKVIAFSSVVRYKGRAVDPKEVVHDLHVGAVLTGRVVQRGDSVAIHAELVDAQDGRRLWGEQYDAKLTGLLTIQDDIAKKISEQLRRRLTGEEERRLTKRYTENTEAYQLYLKGRYYWYKFTPEGYEKSLEYYRQAIDKDPAYALAYCGLADTYLSMLFEGLQPPQDLLPKAEAANHKALEIDDALGEAHMGLASLAHAQWNFTTAAREYPRAIELSPGFVPAHRFYAQVVLRNQGRFDEAIAEMRRAQELDPLSAETNKTLGATLFWAGRTDEAIAQYKKTLELDPNAADVHDLLADAYARKEMHREALAEKQRSLTLEGDEDTAAGLGRDYSTMGYRGAMQALARRDLEAMNEHAKEAYVSPMTFALLYASVGDKDHAFEWLEKAYTEHHPWMGNLRFDPQFEGLRDDPRFNSLLKRVGLPK
jgi:serine/threonine protein kinase/Tfp pilus assembly protein PilF